MLHKSEGNINGYKCFWCSDCAQVWRQLGRVRAEQGGGQLLHNRAGQEVRNIGAAHTTPNIIRMLMCTLKVIFKNLCLQVPKDHKHQLLSWVYWDWSDQGFCHQIWKNTSGDGHAHRWNGIPFDFVSSIVYRMKSCQTVLLKPGRARGARCTWWPGISHRCQTSPVDGILGQTLCAALFTSRSNLILFDEMFSNINNRYRSPGTAAYEGEFP